MAVTSFTSNKKKDYSKEN